MEVVKPCKIVKMEMSKLTAKIKSILTKYQQMIKKRRKSRMLTLF